MTESVGPFRHASCSLISGESPPGDRLPVLQRHCGHPSVLLAGAHAACSGGQLSASGHLSACLAVQAEHRAGHSTVSSTGLLEGRVAHHPCLVRSSWHAPDDGNCFTVVKVLKAEPDGRRSRECHLFWSIDRFSQLATLEPLHPSS